MHIMHGLFIGDLENGHMSKKLYSVGTTKVYLVEYENQTLHGVYRVTDSLGAFSMMLESNHIIIALTNISLSHTFWLSRIFIGRSCTL
jgi:hypothetical protein